MLENNSQFSYPVDHLSYSSMMMFLRNRFEFKKCYILKIYDFKNSPATIVGKAGHKALENYYKGSNVDEAANIGIAYINSVKDDDVEWGKTGSREKVIQDFTKAFNGYIEEAHTPFKVLAVEKEITSIIKYGDQELGLPAKSVSDLIVENEDGELEIIDHKFISTYTESEGEDGAMIFQAMFNYHNIKSEYGRAPKRMIFNEYKLSKNSNGDAQLQPYIIEFDQHQEYHEIFVNIYNEVTREISNPDCLYLPNFQDRFDYSGDTFKDYKAQVITVESPIIVQHKTGDFQFKEKKFVSSPVNIVDNKNLTEEEKIRIKLLEFGLPVEMAETYQGSSVIQYTLKASRGVKMSQFEKYSADLALALKAKTIRVQAPIMGTDLVGIEVPNPDRKIINFYNNDNSLNKQLELEIGTTKIPIGVNVYGKTIVKELKEMPHLLIAGATGSGKSVMINVCIQSLAEQNTDEQLKFVMIDPKRVELAHFKNLPNLIPPIIYDTDKAIKALYWLVELMESRYATLENSSMRDIDAYNNNIGGMHRVVVVIDEFADLILSSKKSEENNSAEKAIIRLAQKARAVGIHLILGTQRPSVDVVTGLIKANFTTRIAFATASKTDSQIILDQSGAEELVGKGDMLFLDPHIRGLQRLQSFYL
jgi:hypothetical protein